MRSVRGVGAGLLLSMLASCASEARRPATGEDAAATPGATEPPPSVAPSASTTPPSAVTGPPSDSATAPSASAAPAPSASASGPAGITTPPRLEVPGATACTDAETDRGWCARGGRGGECIDGTCVTPAACSAYCTAVAARENDCMTPVDAECAKVPACVRDTKLVQDTCKALRQRTAADCRTHACGRIAAMPLPPVSDSRD